MRIDKWFKIFLAMLCGVMVALVIINLIIAMTLGSEAVEISRLEKELLTLELEEMRNVENCY